MVSGTSPDRFHRRSPAARSSRTSENPGRTSVDLDAIPEVAAQDFPVLRGVSIELRHGNLDWRGLVLAGFDRHGVGLVDVAALFLPDDELVLANGQVGNLVLALRVCHGDVG